MPNFTRKPFNFKSKSFSQKDFSPEYEHTIPELSGTNRKTRILKRDGKILVDIRQLYDDNYTTKGVCLPFDFIEKLVDIFPQMKKKKEEIEDT